MITEQHPRTVMDTKTIMVPRTVMESHTVKEPRTIVEQVQKTIQVGHFF